MKPQNIILGDRGPVLIDFGLGAFVDRLGESISSGGRFIGTLCYMAPEQVDGVSRVTAQTDLHALGAVLLYAATGNLPYGNDGAATLNRICDRAAPPDLDGLPAALIPLVGSLLAHDPDDRPSLEAVLATCVELLTAAGTTVRDVRRMLVAETFRETAEPPGRSSSLVARLAGLAEKFAELPGNNGGLDRPVGLGGALVPPPESEPEPEPVAPVSAGRVSARLRVADLLREQYGRQLPLWSSSSRRPA